MRQSKLDFRLINVVGIDGSGKTNLCKALLHELQKNYPATEYVHSYRKKAFFHEMEEISQ